MLRHRPRKLEVVELPMPATGDRIDGYLDEFERRLGAAFPPDLRAEVRLEMRQHLQALIAACEELGDSPEQAVETALRRFGSADRIARRFRRAWGATSPRLGDRWPGGLRLLWLCEAGLVLLLLNQESVLSAPALRFLGPIFLIAPLILTGITFGGGLPGRIRLAGRNALAAVSVSLPLLWIAAQTIGSGQWNSRLSAPGIAWGLTLGWLLAAPLAPRYRRKRSA